MGIVLLGDSLSVGTYPYLKKLRPDVTLFAKVGAPISWMRSQVAAIAAQHPSLVLVMGGANDLPGASPEVVLARMAGLVGELEAHGIPVIVSTIPPEKTANAAKALAYNDLILGKDGSVDVGGAVSPSDLGGDGLHPGPAGYEKLARGWAAVLEEPAQSSVSLFGAFVFAGAAAGGYWWWRARH